MSAEIKSRIIKGKVFDVIEIDGVEVAQLLDGVRSCDVEEYLKDEPWEVPEVFYSEDDIDDAHSDGERYAIDRFQSIINDLFKDGYLTKKTGKLLDERIEEI